jgi:hypothetical protein
MSADSGASSNAAEISAGYSWLPNRTRLAVVLGLREWARHVVLAVWRHPLRCATALLALIWGMGLALFVGAGAHRPLTVTLPCLEPHPVGEHNLVAYRYGTALRTSSYFRGAGSQHHPAFLVDGRERPTVVEKWASDPTDPAPWIELGWSGDWHVQRVRIQHAGAVEATELTSRQYRIACLANRPPPPLQVTDNQAKVAEHQLDCAGARGLRVDFSPGSGDGLVRVFEIEVWGQ